MRYLAGLRKERLISHCMAIVLLLCMHSSVQAREYIRTVVNDPWGSPLIVLDEEGAVIARYTYAPFGSQVSAQAPSRQRLGFVGGIRETPGLHYLKHRYYNPQLGRFYQPDPVTFLGRGTGQINRYAYGLNDPYTFRDISGREFTQIPDEALSTLRVSGSDILTFQWLRQAFAGTISSEDNKQLNNKFLESYLAGQKNFIRSGGLVLLVIPGDELFVANRGIVDVTRVGRWMSQREFNAMTGSGRVVEGAGGRTYVVNPANPAAFTGASRGSSVYAEFNVPTSLLRPGGKPEWSVIPGPGVTTRLYGPPPAELAPVTCIVCVIRNP